VFRRRGFDCSFALRAFPEWKNGKEFYERIMFRDQSPYLLQQEALYLSHKKRFKEAFAVIDEAVQMTRNRNPTIRHSHAIILFQANINGPANDPVVVQTLQRSMTILKECYEYDKRKTYHALKFADHALRYREIYGGAAAAEYLQIAVRWLQEEVRRTPWNRDAKRLLNLVRNATLAASV
jgi:tetratricopeptide (TPR) repeat protein